MKLALATIALAVSATVAVAQNTQQQKPLTPIEQQFKKQNPGVNPNVAIQARQQQNQPGLLQQNNSTRNPKPCQGGRC
jgi:hypothetical protein